MTVERIPEVNKKLLKKLDSMDSESVADLIYAWLDDDEGALEDFIKLLRTRQ